MKEYDKQREIELLRKLFVLTARRSMRPAMSDNMAMHCQYGITTCALGFTRTHLTSSTSTARKGTWKKSISKMNTEMKKQSV